MTDWPTLQLSCTGTFDGQWSFQIRFLSLSVDAARPTGGGGNQWTNKVFYITVNPSHNYRIVCLADAAPARAYIDLAVNAEPESDAIDTLASPDSVIIA